LAEETETQGSEFPIFKSGEGAFDRAKYKQEESAMITPTGQLTGKEIDEDLRKKKKSADEVIKEANKFYTDSFRKNLRALDPAYDPDSIYYKEAYSGDGSDRLEIKSRIDDGEALDGKEISEMSKKTAENKLGNAQILKTGNVTQIVENLGIRNIKEYEKYDTVKEEFDSKITDENFKFDSLLKKFSSILHFLNDDGSTAGQTASALYTPENNSIISALAKILEGEGFGGESVLAMSKRYEENLGKLIDKSKGGSIESMKMTKEGDVVKSTGEGVTEEKKLEEKKEESPAATVPPPATVEESKVAPVEPAGENKPVENKTQEVAPAISSAETKLGEVKNPTGGTGSAEELKSVKSEDGANTKYNSIVKDLFGIDLGGAGGTGGTGGTGDNKETGKIGSETEKLAAKKAEDLLSSPKRESGSTGGTDKKEPEKKSEGAKLETKIDKKNDKVNETLPVSTGKIETTAQNLSSVSNPVEKPKEPESTSVSTTNTAATTNTSSDMGSSESNTTESPKSESTNNEKKEGSNKTEGEGNNEMLDTMKNISSLLTQLNNTMQGPLIVTPTNKKFQ
jgi:hypothetical protein